MNRIFFKIISAVTILVLGSEAAASELTEAATTVRTMGMGGAGSAIISGLEALYVNPAGLNRNDGIEFTALSPTVTANKSAWDAIMNYSSLTGAENVRDYLQPYVGNEYGLGVNSNTGIATKNFAASFFFDLEIYESLHNLALPELKSKTYYQYGLKFGASYGLFENSMLRVGAAIKWLTRRGLADTATTETLLSLDTSEFTGWLDRKGRGYGLDLGMIFTVPLDNEYLEPCISLSWQDVFTTTIKPSSVDALSPGRLHDNLTLGLGTMINLPALDIAFAFDIKHLTERGIQIPLKLHMGAELQFPVFSVRGGYNQGYYTAGLSFNLFLFRLELLTYGEELGSYPGQMEDRRYMLQIVGSFSLFKDFKMEM
ncbi:MAG: hypothetical protein JXA66_05895 [Oligoflexia bacterium]|nr:hypothetical protein [Oligoflexia bacterium]